MLGISVFLMCKCSKLSSFKKCKYNTTISTNSNNNKIYHLIEAYRNTFSRNHGKEEETSLSKRGRKCMNKQKEFEEVYA